MSDILLISLIDNMNSIGIRSISAYLKKWGYRPTLLFLPTFVKPNEKELKEISSFIKSLDPNLIGISFMSLRKHSAIELTKALKTNTKIPIIWGGIHATVCPEESLEYADMVCIGDGEIAVVDLLRNRKSEIIDFQKEVKNIWFKDKEGKIIKNPLHIPTENYDFLPFLDYSLENNYILSEGRISKLSWDLAYKYLHRFYMDPKKPSYIMPSNRGCIFNCSFCSNSYYNKSYGRYNRSRSYSIERIISELEYVKDNLTIFKSIWIYDLDICQNSIEWIQEFSNIYREKIAMPFAAFMSSNTFCYQKFELLTKAGLTYGTVGIQSLSKRINSKIFNRPFDLDKLLIMLEKIKKSTKPFLNFDLIVNNPYMNIYDRIESFVASLKIAKVLIGNKIKYRVTLGELRFYPGTKLTEIAKKDKRLKDIDAKVRIKAKGYEIRNWVVWGPLFYFPFMPERFLRKFLFVLHRLGKLRRKSSAFFNRIRSYVNTREKDFTKVIKEKWLWLITGFDPPKKIFVEISSYCNLKCMMCPFDKIHENSPKNMSSDTFKKILPLIKLIPIVQLSGLGEPLLNDNLISFIKLIRQENPIAEIILTTNGTLLTEQISRELIKLKISRITISIDGANAETVENIRRNLNFSQLLENVRNLQRLKKENYTSLPMIRANYVVGYGNYEELADFVKLACDLEIKEIFLLECQSSSYKDNFLNNIKRDNGKILKEALELAERANIKFILPSGLKNRCLWPYCSLIVEDGRIFPCPYLMPDRQIYIEGSEARMPTVSFGNINEHNFITIWNSKKFRDFRKRCRKGEFSKYCTACHNFKIPLAKKLRELIDQKRK